MTRMSMEEMIAHQARVAAGRKRQLPGRSEHETNQSLLARAIAGTYEQRQTRRPTNARNDGRSFEERFLMVALQYQSEGLLRLKKVEPPVRVIGGGQARKVIFLDNPFLDFVGTWTERGGRAVFIEAKSTTGERLPMGGDSGLTRRQIDAMRDWHRAGAVVGLVWEAEGVVRWVRLAEINGALRTRKHLRPEDGLPVPAGKGFVVFDFLAVMRGLHPVDTSVNAYPGA